MLSTGSVIMAVFGFLIFYGGLGYFLSITLRQRHLEGKTNTGNEKE